MLLFYLDTMNFILWMIHPLGSVVVVTLYTAQQCTPKIKIEPVTASAPLKTWFYK